jgi:hypothetical protein
MSEHRILRLKPALGLGRRGQQGQNKTDKRDHRANLADSSLNKPGAKAFDQANQIRAYVESVLS